MTVLTPTSEHIEWCAQQLAQGALVGMPTETVYGLAANARDARAVECIFTTKGRPNDHPVIVHVAGARAIPVWAQQVSEQALQLAQAFWPGPLTLILPRAAHTPLAVTGGQDTVGLRCPSHPIAQQLLQAFGRALNDSTAGLAAPSANRFGHVSPTTAQHVASEFAHLPVLDGGACAVGIESTIVDCTRGEPIVLRPGAITPAMMAQCLGHSPAVHQKETDPTAPRASGLLESHYAPVAPVMLFATGQLQTALAAFVQTDKFKIHRTRQGQPITVDTAQLKLTVMHYSVMDWQHLQISAHIHMSAEADQYAHALYASLRTLDQQSPDLIAVEQVPSTPDWLAVADRLKRSAA